MKFETVLNEKQKIKDTQLMKYDNKINYIKINGKMMNATQAVDFLKKKLIDNGNKEVENWKNLTKLYNKAKKEGLIK